MLVVDYFKSFGQAFLKDCGVKGQSHLSPSAGGEIPYLRSAFTEVNLKTVQWTVFKKGTLCK